METDDVLQHWDADVISSSKEKSFPKNRWIENSTATSPTEYSAEELIILGGISSIFLHLTLGFLKTYFNFSLSYYK